MSMHSSNPTSASATMGQRLSFESGPGRAARLAKEFAVPALFLAFAAYLLVGIVTMQVPAGTSFPGPQFFPGLIAAALTLLAVLLVVRVVRERRTEQAEAEAGVAKAVLLDDQAAVVASTDASDASAADATKERAVRVDVRSLLWVVGTFAAFALLLNVLGWIVAAAMLFVGVARGLGERRIVGSIVVGLTLSSLSYIAFDMLLELSLPSGIVGWGF